MVAWIDKVGNLRRVLGRDPTLEELLVAAKYHRMTPEEVDAQRMSFARANISTGDPRFD